MSATTTIDSTIDLDALRSIRKALIVGLASFGEIERLQNAFEIQAVRGEEIPEDMHPIHPTGNCDTVGEFANALAFVDILEDERREADQADSNRRATQ